MGRLKRNAKFYLEHRKDKESKTLIITNVPINLSFTYEGKRLLYYTGYRIDKSCWDESTQRVNDKSVNKDGIDASLINKHLNKIKSSIEDIYDDSKALKRKINNKFLAKELKKQLGEPNKVGNLFFDIFQEFIDTEEKNKSWSESTKKKFKALKIHLEKFQAHRKTKITFDSFDQDFASELAAYYYTELKHRNTNIVKNIRNIKWFLKWAIKKKYADREILDDFSVKLTGTKGASKQKKIIGLTWDEYKHLFNLEINKTYLAQVRDVLCFQCATAMRYGDVENLKRANIKDDRITYTSLKTDEYLEVPFTSFSREIIDRYKDIKFDDDKCLPVISNQKMNEYLKELGQAADFNGKEQIIYHRGTKRIEKTKEKWELLTTHVGRRTFYKIARYLKIPMEVTMAIAGHHDYKIVLENYYNVDWDTMKREMKKIK